MSDPQHEAFAEAAAAYALGALDASDRAGFEAHLATCASCRADVEAYRQVSGALGASVAPVAPPLDLKARVLANAPLAPGGVERRAFNPVRPPRSSALWLAAAASLALHAGLGYYAWSVRTQLATASDLAARATAYAERLRTELAQQRNEAAMGSRIAEVLSSPDVIRIELRAAKDGFPGQALGYFSRSRGMWFAADTMPAPAAGRTYQLWIVAPGQPPISAGLLPLDARGSVAMVRPTSTESIPARSTLTLAITDEPAGGSPGPTTPILLAGTGRIVS
jgi:anti-sigma-K factor RskA